MIITDTNQRVNRPQVAKEPEKHYRPARASQQFFRLLLEDGADMGLSVFETISINFKRLRDDSFHLFYSILKTCLKCFFVQMNSGNWYVMLGDYLLIWAGRRLISELRCNAKTLQK
jgi:hypothetical protein